MNEKLHYHLATAAHSYRFNGVITALVFGVAFYHAVTGDVAMTIGFTLLGLMGLMVLFNIWYSRRWLRVRARASESVRPRTSSEVE